MMNKFPEASALIETGAGTETRILSTEIFSLPSIVWRSREGASLVVGDPANAAPGLIWVQGEPRSRSLRARSTALSLVSVVSTR